MNQPAARVSVAASRLLALLLGAGVCGATWAADESKPATVGAIERVDPRLDDYLAPDAKIEKLGEGFEWTEGPVWVKDGGYLLFSDIPHNVVHRWSPDKGVTEFLKPSGFTGKQPPEGTKEPGSNGLTVGPDGSLVLAQHGDRRVAKLGKNGMFETLADKFEGKRFNSPNDLCFDKAGNLFFTDPPYGLPNTFKSELRELPFTGVYRLAKEGGAVTAISKDMTAPNGIALSPDEKTLYVANSDGKKPVIMAFAIKEDGTAHAGKVFFDATNGVNGKKGGFDGMKVAADGTLFATGPGGVLVITPDGKHLGTIAPGPQPTANVAFGDADGMTLYMTSDMYLCRVRLKVKGNGF